jgi:hypothetical protein
MPAATPVPSDERDAADRLVLAGDQRRVGTLVRCHVARRVAAGR